MLRQWWRCKIQSVGWDISHGMAGRNYLIVKIIISQSKKWILSFLTFFPQPLSVCCCWLQAGVGGIARFSLEPRSIPINNKSSWLLCGQGGKGGLICRSPRHQRISEGVREGVSKGVGALDSFWQCRATDIRSASLRVAAWLFFQLIILRYFYWRILCVWCVIMVLLILVTSLP